MDFEKKIDKLSKHLEKTKGTVSKKDKCFPTMLIAGIAVPILVFLLLYFLQPGFVQKEVNGQYTRNNTKVMGWTTIITLVLWVAMYLFTYCRGYNKASFMCLKK